VTRARTAEPVNSISPDRKKPPAVRLHVSTSDLSSSVHATASSPL
jgi:hypothetical protein